MEPKTDKYSKPIIKLTQKKKFINKRKEILLLLSLIITKYQNNKTKNEIN